MAVLPLSSLPVGYRFRPTDEELVSHYLKNKINGKEDIVSDIGEVDLCKKEPWDLPGNQPILFGGFVQCSILMNLNTLIVLIDAPIDIGPVD